MKLFNIQNLEYLEYLCHCTCTTSADIICAKVQ